jgi:MATE family multidrug resistance protein
VFPTVAPSIFTTDPDLLSMSVASLRIVALGFVFVVPADILFNAVVGTGDTTATLAIEVAATVGFLGLASAFVFALGLPLAWVWAAEVAGLLMFLAPSWIWPRGGRWVRSTV